MLWSLVKILLFISLVAALTFGVSAWMDNGEGVLIAIGGMEFSPGPLQTLILIVLLFLAVWLVIRIAGFLAAVFRFLSGDETALSRYFDRNRERKGYQALADGMLALASGEGKLALSKAAKAERFLRRPDLTDLLSAQAAELIGDRARAEAIYKRLLPDARTRFVGVRGLMKQRLEAGESELALKLAEKAFILKPRHEETQDVLLALQAEGEDWSGARATLGAKLRYGAIPKSLHRRRDAVLALAGAREAADGSDGPAADAGAIEANRLSPDLVPAAVMAAAAQARAGAQRKAVNLLRKAWTAAPHPDLAAAFAALVPDETPGERLARFAPLLKAHPDHGEIRMLEAELLIAAEDFPAARKTMGDFAETHPTARALSMMAAIERGLGADDAGVQGWLARAVTANRGDTWICDKCRTAHSEWQPLCNRCQGFDTLSWQSAPADEANRAATAGMMPLILGTANGPESADTARDPARDTASDPASGEEDHPPPPDDVGLLSPVQPATDYVTEEPSPEGGKV